MGLRAVRKVALESNDPPPIASNAQSTRFCVPAPASNAPVRRNDGPATSRPSVVFPSPDNQSEPIPIPSRQPFTSPILSTGEKRQILSDMDEKEVRGCTRCHLSEGRTHTVFGEGDADAQLMFIGEGPGENEDLSGRPFVGRAGEMLNKWIAAMGLRREQVFIANIVKCRPPANRVPSLDEVATCAPYLDRQIEIIRPKVIVTLGLPATQYMLQTKITMGRTRGTWQNWRGIKLMPTYHPAYVLRQYTTETRAAVWNDLQMVMKELGLSAHKKSS